MNRASRSRVERLSVLRRRLLLAGWIIGATAILARSIQVQVLHSEFWIEVALRQHRTSQSIAAPRGAILDRHGSPLAASLETVRVSVAPRELDDSQEAAELLSRALGLSVTDARRHTDPDLRWSVIPGHFDPSIGPALRGVRGVYLETAFRRVHPGGDLARGLLGAVIDGAGSGGVEQVFDSILKGTPGIEVAARDNAGREIPGEKVLVQAPLSGGDVHLTIDLDLQEIAHQALSNALAATGAQGGDIVVTGPHTGEVLALSSIKGGRADGLSVINAPYEPGSTLKPFTVSGLLKHQLAELGDSVDTGGGVWMVGGRPLSDVHDYGTISLADALRVSSNVGVAKAARALAPGQQYELLRDFGFGVPTGVPLPGEVSGVLRRPEDWSARSAASLAIGYEIAVTPLQMAMAYGVLANGGMLVAPSLVRGTRPPGGGLDLMPTSRTLRRVVSPSVALQVRRVLVDVVEDGTGKAARLETFQVAGKSGTSRQYVPGSGYERGRYFSSFAAFFPADDPQLVVFVKLDSPLGAFYGGAIAAPVTRATMEAALAARQTPLDRSALLRSVRQVAGRPDELPSAGPVRFAELPTHLAAPPAADGAFTGTRSAAATRAPDAPRVPVPDVRGLSTRTAVRRLHAVGLRVRWNGASPVMGSLPDAGTYVVRGDTVSLRAMALEGR